MSSEEKRLLEKQLWGVANVLRGKMHADEYRNYILGFIFYKYLSEKLERYVDEKLLIGEELIFTEIKESTKEGREYLSHIKTACLEHLGFFLKPVELFSYLVRKGKGGIEDQSKFILGDLKNVLDAIERTSAGTASEDDFKGLFDDLDLTSSKLGLRESEKNEVIVEVLTLLSGIDFKLEDSKSDLLGDAYEYLIGEFATNAGKKSGEFYTPAQVSRLLARIVSVGKKRIRSAYDATCGSGSLLLRLGEFAEVSKYYGQELNPTTYNLARMNMILHGIHFDHFAIKQGDTLREDMHPDLKAEAIVANPPFSAKWRGDADPALAHDDRFSQYGRLAPKGAADYAFVTHMLHHLSDNGTMAIVLPHGVLFRSGAEAHIRKFIIEKQNYLDAVIGLPINLFYGTPIPAVILVFKKCRRDDESILFIDASSEFDKGQKQNKLTDKNIEKVYETYEQRKEVKKYSHRASLEEIKKNAYNLNIPLYVDTFEKDEPIDIGRIAEECQKIQFSIERAEIDEKVSLLETQRKVVNKYKEGLLQKLFSQEIRFRSVEGKKFPNWKKVPLGDVLKESDERTTVNDQFQVLSSTIDGVYIQSEYFNQNVASNNNIGYKVLRRGQLVLSPQNLWLGNININVGFEIGIVSPSYKVFNINTEIVLISYLKYVIKTSRMLYEYKISSEQGASVVRRNLVPELFDNIPLNLPSIAEQCRIIDFLVCLDYDLHSRKILKYCEELGVTPPKRTIT
jgi:type I restriction enzyme M protein